MLLPLPAQTDPEGGTAPKAGFSRTDSLRGALTPLCTCYDVGFYNPNVRVNVADRSISGYNTIVYKATADFQQFQVDLFQNLNLSQITH